MLPRWRRDHAGRGGGWSTGCSVSGDWKVVSFNLQVTAEADICSDPNGAIPGTISVTGNVKIAGHNIPVSVSDQLSDGSVTIPFVSELGISVGFQAEATTSDDDDHHTLHLDMGVYISGPFGIGSHTFHIYTAPIHLDSNDVCQCSAAQAVVETYLYYFVAGGVVLLIIATCCIYRRCCKTVQTVGVSIADADTDEAMLIYDNVYKDDAANRVSLLATTIGSINAPAMDEPAARRNANEAGQPVGMMLGSEHVAQTEHNSPAYTSPLYQQQPSQYMTQQPPQQQSGQGHVR